MVCQYCFTHEAENDNGLCDFCNEEKDIWHYIWPVITIISIFGGLFSLFVMWWALTTQPAGM